MEDALSPLISFLIPAYNHEEYIQDTIRSVWAQKCPSCEIIVLDDGSSDGTAGVARRMAAISPVPLEVISRPNKGLNRTANELLRAARGEFVSLIASDDCYLPGAIPHALEVLVGDRSVQAVYGNGRVWLDGVSVDERIYKDEMVDTLRGAPDGVLRYLYTHVPFLLTQACVFRLSFIREVGGYDEDAALDDWPLHIRVFRALGGARRHVYLDTDLVLYRRHQTNSSRDVRRQVRQVVDTAMRYVPDEFRPKLLGEALHRLGLVALLKNPVLGVQLILASQKHDRSLGRVVAAPVAICRALCASIAARMSRRWGSR